MNAQEEKKDLRVLVTGGGGFIGSHIVDACVKAGHDVAVLDNFSTGSRNNVNGGARIFDANIVNRQATFSVISKFSPHVVCHQAAHVSVPESMQNPALDCEVNCIGTMHLIEALTKLSCFKRFVFASSGGAVYGESQNSKDDPGHAELTSVPAPKNPYGINKLSIELHLHDVWRWQYPIEAKILRYSNVYGPRQATRGEGGVIATYFRNLKEGKKLKVYAMHEQGDTGCVRDYVYVDDVVKANMKAIEGKYAFDYLNVSSGQKTDTATLATMCASTYHNGIPEGPVSDWLEFLPPRLGDIRRSSIDPTRFKQLVGEPTPLKVGLERYLEWLKEHGR